MKTITIRREPGYYGMVRALQILVDGHQVGSIRQKENITLDLPDAAGVLEGKMDWGKTDPVNLQAVQDGQTVTFQAYFSLNPMKIFALDGIPVRVSVS